MLLFLYSAIMNIKRQLVKGDYKKALAVLKAALVTWPKYELFQSAIAQSIEQGQSTNAAEKEGYLACWNSVYFSTGFLPSYSVYSVDCFFRNEEEMSERKKEDIVCREMSLLKKIFLSKFLHKNRR